MKLDYLFAQRASKRNGAAFKLQLPPNATTNTSRHRRLTQDDVDAIRTWSAEHGNALTFAEQARRLHADHPHVKPQTLIEVLRNVTWYDPEYVPYSGPQEEHWKRQQRRPGALGGFVFGGFQS